MDSISTAASFGVTARLFQHLRVGGEPLADRETTSRSRASQLGDPARPQQGPRMLPGPRAATAPAKADKQTRNNADDPKPNATALRFERSGDATVFLTTQEGDTIQIKIKNQASMMLDGGELQPGDTLVSQLRLESKESSKLSLVVNGDLNADEMRAIGGVIEQVSAIAQDFFAGNVSDAFATAERFDIDGTQLANAAVGMHMEEVLTYSSRSGPVLQNLAATEPSKPAASETKPAGAADSPLTSSASDTQPAPQTHNGVKAGPSRLLNNARVTHPLGIHESLDVIGSFLKGLMDKLKQPVPGEKAGEAPAAGIALKIKIFQSVITTAAAGHAQDDAERAPLPALVGETLDALSAKHEPTLSTVV